MYMLAEKTKYIIYADDFLVIYYFDNTKTSSIIRQKLKKDKDSFEVKAENDYSIWISNPI